VRCAGAERERKERGESSDNICRLGDSISDGFDLRLKNPAEKRREKKKKKKGKRKKKRLSTGDPQVLKPAPCGSGKKERKKRKGRKNEGGPSPFAEFEHVFYKFAGDIHYDIQGGGRKKKEEKEKREGRKSSIARSSRGRGFFSFSLCAGGKKKEKKKRRKREKTADF